MAEYVRVVEDLGRQTTDADQRLSELFPHAQAAQQAWQARQRRVLDRAVAAVHELQGRENGLLDDDLDDPPAHLTELLDRPPSDPAGRQAWREQALHLERDQVTARAGEPYPDTERGRERARTEIAADDQAASRSRTRSAVGRCLASRRRAGLASRCPRLSGSTPSRLRGAGWPA